VLNFSVAVLIGYTNPGRGVIPSLCVRHQSLLVVHQRIGCDVNDEHEWLMLTYGYSFRTHTVFGTFATALRTGLLYIPSSVAVGAPLLLMLRDEAVWLMALA